MCFSRTSSSTAQPLSAFSGPDIVPSLSNAVFPSAWLSSKIPQSTPESCKNLVQHNYHDHSHEAVDELSLSRELLKARGGVATPFPIKLHHMLKCTAADGLDHIVRWAPHGRAFVVHKPKEFVEIVLRKYFNQTKIASFQRQLNLYGFNRLTKGPDKNGYYHELFIRTKPLLAHKIHRFKIKGTLVRQRANPDQEPNFYSMSPLEEESAQPQVPRPDSPTSSPKSVLCPTTMISPDDVASVPSLTVDPLFCLPDPSECTQDDTISAFGRDFVDISTEQSDQRYRLDDVAEPLFTPSADSAQCDEMKSILERVDSEGPTLGQMDDTPIELDEDFTKLLEGIVSHI